MSHKDRALDVLATVVTAAVIHALTRWVDKFFDPPNAEPDDDTEDAAHPTAVIDELTP